MDKLKKVELDVQEGKLTVNGVELPRVTYFKLEFKGYHWSLTTTEEFWVKSGEKKLPKE